GVIRNACCCSTSTTRTTARHWRHRRMSSGESGRWRGWCGSRICFSRGPSSSSPRSQADERIEGVEGREAMTVVEAWREGGRRAVGAPWIIVGGWVATILIALPLAHLLGRQIAGQLGRSLAASQVGVNFDWWNEFLAQSGGIGQTFVPAILGFAAVLKNISDIADAKPRPLGIA